MHQIATVINDSAAGPTLRMREDHGRKSSLGAIVAALAWVPCCLEVWMEYRVSASGASCLAKLHVSKIAFAQFIADAGAVLITGERQDRTRKHIHQRDEDSPDPARRAR